MNRRDHRFPRLDQQLVAPEAKSRLGIDLRPVRKKSIQFIFRRSFGGLVPCAGSDLRDTRMIDRARRPREVRQNVLVVVAPTRQHRFDQRDLPPL